MPSAVALGEVLLGTLTTGIMDLALAKRLDGEAGVSIFDIFGLLQSPALASFKNVSDACGAVAGCDPSTYLFWDGIHPTSAAHQVIADALLAATQVTQVPEPASVWLLILGLGSVTVAARVAARGKAADCSVSSS